MAKAKTSDKKRSFRLARPATNQLTTLILTAPLFLFYEIGVLFTDQLNGADLITTTLLDLIGLQWFLRVHLILAAIVLAIVLYLRRKQKFNFRQFLPVIFESGIYALTMGTLIVFVMADVLKIDPHLATEAADPIVNAGLLDRLVIAVGAGFHEELVFRLGLFGGLTVVTTRFLKVRPWLAVLAALFVSSLLFSAAHHIGPHGDPWRLGIFTYRALAGLFFGTLFQFRGFVTAVYTHTLYDIYVLLLH